jgi:hypothetical protein
MFHVSALIATVSYPMRLGARLAATCLHAGVMIFFTGAALDEVATVLAKALGMAVVEV